MFFLCFICSYIFYIIILNLTLKCSFYLRILYLTREIIYLNAMIDLYERYIDEKYKEYVRQKQTCITFFLNNNNSVTSIIIHMRKVNGDFIIYGKDNTSLLFSNILDVKLQPNLEYKKNLHVLLQDKLPKEIINYIGEFICNCRLCKDIKYPL